MSKGDVSSIMTKPISSESLWGDALSGRCKGVVRCLAAEKIEFKGWKIGLFGYFPPFCFASCGWTDDQMKIGIKSFERVYWGDVFVKVSWQSAQRVRHKSAAKVVYFREFMILKVTSSKLDIYWETQSSKSVACLAGWLTVNNSGALTLDYLRKGPLRRSWRSLISNLKSVLSYLL